ncbi:hypothetical protein [Novosphingobium sp. KA1]|uniref:hypothetical protein n=1 Tax=Novosphingobium sp. (strain KA1) TaxID=164608 RepID=UPI001A903B83|nr:hypothetical protein [Novosphingobium sp. KA1]
MTLINGGGSPNALWTPVPATMRGCDAIRALGIKVRNGTFGGDLHEVLRPGRQRAAEIPGNRGIRPYPRGNIEPGKAGRQVMKAFTSVLGSRIRCSTMRSYPAK